ncbi:type III secretion system export apparatus subunit SctU [Noviherbaspirillum pedocola]|uniref:Type III secretion system export apparatus subunit SctU n=1 Tax=Noviherbaspirillum pedocola TaxID=2801341 RepID=A0A934SMK7_9BURK|nr:type III secretion system export apparatus subunit SctU [Noviherbaspirillum pedocola]MBK4733245.1 type III secretion system export apparatus subunit SctU [Noviherbaspirillum pedocola]
MSEEKTEEPTPHKLRKAREEGQVPKSKDFTQTLLLGSLFVYTIADSSRLIRHMAQIIVMPSYLHGVEFRNAYGQALTSMVTDALLLLLPYLILVLLIGIFAEAVQTGLVFSFKPIMPKGEKLNPVSNLKQMFAMKNIIEFIKSNLKVIALSAVVYMVLRNSLDLLVHVPPAGIVAAGVALGAIMEKLVIFTFLLFGVIALADLVYQRYEYRKGLRMSLDEVKKEYKELEGDPHMKGHRKQVGREIAMGEGVQKTKKASVVVTNPTHLAVSLYYKDGETPLPIVLNKGSGAVAHAIVKVARDAGIPVMQNVPLARGLMAEAMVGQYIPSELVEPVAEVLLALRRLAQEHGEWS